MYTLAKLQEMGAILGSLRMVSVDNSVNISNLEHLSMEEQEIFDGSVIVDNAKWVATVSAIPTNEASNVYSSDGNVVGKWQREKRTFYVMKLKGDKLVTVNSIHLKEEKRMGDFGTADVSDIDVNEINVSLDEISEEIKGDLGVKEMDSFSGGVIPEPKESDAKDTTAKKERERQIDEITRALADNNNNVAVTLPDPVIRHNYLHGRLFGFITSTDDAVKLSTTKVPKKDSNGNIILVPEAPAEIKAKAAEKKRVPALYCECERVLNWKHAKPGAIKAVVIGTPVGTDIPLTYVGNVENVPYNTESTDLKVYVMGTETAFSYIPFNYASAIKESEEMIGAKAGVVRTEVKVVIDSKGEDKFQKKFVHDTSLRKTLLTEGNFFPLRLYQTISTQDVSAEDAEILNLNVEAVFKKCSINELCDEHRKLIQVREDGSFSSVWFDDGAPIEVSRYDDKQSLLADVRVPKRMKHTAEKGGNVTYKFLYDGLEDRENGPLSRPQYAHFVKATGLEQDVFVQMVEKATSKVASSKKSSNKKGTISYDVYLRAMYNKDIKVTTRGLRDLQMELDQVDQLA